MSTHLITDPTAALSAPSSADPGWLSLSAAMTREVPAIANRRDLLVAIAPGAGQGSPACFIPPQARIEIDGTHLGTVDPATANPATAADRARYATAWGLLVHECGHAQHSGWTPPPGTDPAVIDAAMLLEEARMETAQLARRRDDRHWLRASATNLILNDTGAADPAHGPAMTAHDAARAAALLLARMDGGILTKAEVDPVRRAILKVIGGPTLAKLRRIWRKALTTKDNDAKAMIRFGRRWLAIVGPEPTPEPTMPAPGSGPSSDTPRPGPSPLGKAIVTSTTRIAAAVATEPLPPDPAATAKANKAAEHSARNRASTTAEKVFGRNRHGGPDRTTTPGTAHPRTATPGTTTPGATRPPTAQEHIAARTLARALTTAGTPDRVRVTRTSATPPGRVRMRGVLAAEAQQAAGAIVTAEPFTRTTRVAVPTPPLRLGIACDVSGSMKSLAGPVASAAWIFANATRHTSVAADTATVIFGEHVRPITRPGVVPTQVTEFDADDTFEAADTAIDALDGALGLALPGAARLLVIVSDGRYKDTPRDVRKLAQQRVDRLRATGCGVLWLALDNPKRPAKPLDGVTVCHLDDPASTARTVGRAAVAALRAATR